MRFLTLLQEYVTTAATGGNASYFPSADLALLNDQEFGDYDLYYKADTDLLVYLGRGANEVETFDNDRVELIYPFMFGDSFEDSFT